MGGFCVDVNSLGLIKKLVNLNSGMGTHIAEIFGGEI